MRTLQARANTATLKKLVVVACVMFGFGFAMVPFYKKMCEVTGLNNIIKPDTITNTQVDASRTLTMEFDVERAQRAAVDVSATRAQRAFSSGRARPGGVRSEEQLRPRADGTGDPELRPAGRGRARRVSWNASASRSRRCSRARCAVCRSCSSIETTLPEDVNTITLSYTFFAGRRHGRRSRMSAMAEPTQSLETRRPLEVAKAVFWSFLGIRKRAAHERDAVTLKPAQVIVAGLIGAVIFVLSLVALVRFITR